MDDDDIAVDGDWLSNQACEVGDECLLDFDCFATGGTEPAWHACFSHGEDLVVANIVKNRGDVRRLKAGLGIAESN